MLDHELLSQLFKLYNILHHGVSGENRDSLLEKYNYFVEHSEKGKDCTYAQKSAYLFERDDWNSVRELILSIRITNGK